MTELGPVIVVGAGRSGTKLVRDLIAGLPGFSTWPCDEINYIWRHGNRDAPTDELTVADARPEVRRYIGGKFEAQRRRGNSRAVVEKTCATTLRIGFANTVLPDARFVVVVRDGHDVAVSAAARWTARIAPRYLLRKARFVPPSDLPYYATRYARSRMSRRRMSDRRLSTWGPRFAGIDDAVSSRPLLEVCAMQWARCVDAADRQLSEHVSAEAIHRLRYEELVTSPDRELARLAEFVGAPPPSMASLGLVSSRRAAGSNASLTTDDRHAIDTVAGPTLARYGYLR